jgi:5-methylcytosine-specific restriction endonuclease McrA
VPGCANCGVPLTHKQVKRGGIYCSRQCGSSWRIKTEQDIRATRRAKQRRHRLRHRDRYIESGRAAYAADPERHRQKNHAWRLRNPEKTREANRKFREEHPEYSLAWRHANKDRVAGYDRDFAQRNPQKIAEKRARRRALLRNAPEVEKIDRLLIYARDSGICHICGRHVQRSSFTLDHLIPLAHGGPHVASNLGVAHFSCNSRRGDGRIPAQLLLIG